MNTLQEQLEEVKAKIAELKEWNFGICPNGPHFNSLLDIMWELEEKIKGENK